jgi:hypothetical protein
MITLLKALNKSRKPIYRFLEKHYGGKWTYDRRTSVWNCDDNKRYAVYVSNNFYNEHYPEVNHPPSLYIYSSEKGFVPIRVY